MKNLMIAILAAVFAFTVRAQGEGARRAQYDGSLQKGAEPDSVSGRPRLQGREPAREAVFWSCTIAELRSDNPLLSSVSDNRNVRSHRQSGRTLH